MKRIMLGLLFDGENFYLSRNFRLQKLGDLSWLRKNFQIFELASFVDEIVVFHIVRRADTRDFADALGRLAEEIFVPLSVGGGIRSVDDADRLFRAGADRVLFSEMIWTDPLLVRAVGDKYGKQAVVGVLNFTSPSGGEVMIRRAGPTEVPLTSHGPSDVDDVLSLVGELVLQSIDRDGTGQGFPLDELTKFDGFAEVPWIAAGGFGVPDHFARVLSDDRVQAALTSNLLAFVGNGLELARAQATQSRIQLAVWEPYAV